MSLPINRVGASPVAILDQLHDLNRSLARHAAESTELAASIASLQAAKVLLNAELKVITNNPKYPTI